MEVTGEANHARRSVIPKVVRRNQPMQTRKGREILADRRKDAEVNKS